MEKTRIPKFKRKSEGHSVSTKELNTLVLFERVFQDNFGKEAKPIFLYLCKPNLKLFEEVSRWILLIDEYSKTSIDLKKIGLKKVEVSLDNSNKNSNLKLILESHSSTELIDNILLQRKSDSGFKMLYSSIEQSIILKRVIPTLDTTVESSENTKVSNTTMANL